MKTLKLSITILALSLFLMASEADARGGLTSVSCTWSNGDHFSFTSSNDAFIDSMIAHCMDTGGTAQF